jgi:hypothetical protein
MKRFGLLLVLLFTFTARAHAADVFVAQTAAGTGDGSSCANARAKSFFNSSANWGTGAAQIGPGTVVRLCGALSGDLNFQGDGVSGNPVVLDGAGSTINGNIVNSATRNFLTIRNMAWTGGGNIFLGAASGMCHDIVILNNVITNSIVVGSADLLQSEGCYNVTVEGNNFTNRAVSTPSDHNDMIQTWAKGGAASFAPHDWTIRYNRFIMDTTAQNDMSCHMLEGFGGKLDIYGNVYIGLHGGSSANCVDVNSGGSGFVMNFYGNTIAQKAGGFNNLLNLQGSGTFNLRNNIIFSTDAGNELTGGAATNRSNNLWFGSGAPTCVATEICGQNPQFANLAANDVSLLPASPAKAHGSVLGAPYNAGPANGASWPNPSITTKGATWDMGAMVAGGGPPVVTISITPTSVTLAPSATQQFTATVTNTPNTAVTWSATCGSVSTTGFYTAPASVGNCNVTVTSVADPSKAANAPVAVQTTPPPPLFSTVRIRSGGGTVTDTTGNIWAADKLFSGGSTYCNTKAISNTTNPALYQCERWGTAFTYTIPAPAGSYVVTLKFAEIFYTSTNSRVFNVAINGSPVLSSFDIVAQAGAANRALDRTFPVTLANAGNIVISFSLGSKDDPKLSSLMVAASGPPPPPPVIITLAPTSKALIIGDSQQFATTVSNTPNTAVTWSANAPGGLFTALSTGSFTVTATSVADPTKSASASVTVTLPPPQLGLTCTALVCTFTPTNIPSGTPIQVSGSSAGVTVNTTTSVP